MKRGYGQYCPLALAAELFGQRWTLLVMSRVIDGCTTFTEIHRGVPRISPSLLSKRLDELVCAGLVERHKQEGKRTYTYHPTEAGWDLEDIIMRMAIWGQHWGRDMSMDDLDPAFLAWSIHMRIDTAKMPDKRIVLEFDFTGIPEGLHRFWLVSENGKVEMCLKDPGFETDVLVNADIRYFVETWRGLRDMYTEIKSGRIRLTGPRDLTRAFPDWMMLSELAPYDRKRQGRERNLFEQSRLSSAA